MGYFWPKLGTTTIIMSLIRTDSKYRLKPVILQGLSVVPSPNVPGPTLLRCSLSIVCEQKRTTNHGDFRIELILNHENPAQ